MFGFSGCNRVYTLFLLMRSIFVVIVAQTGDAVVPTDRRCVAGLGDLVEPVCGHHLHALPHHWVMVEDGIEVLDGQREQVAEGLRSHVCHALGVRQQTDLWKETNNGC